MKRVTGIGGIFFKARDPVALRAWYQRHLGIDVQEWGGAAFAWTDDDGKPTPGTTIWSVGGTDSNQFAPSSSSFMVNYRVAADPAQRRLQRAREGGRFRIWKVRLGHGSGGQQGGTLAATGGPMTLP
jgi:hypothetical protein